MSSAPHDHEAEQAVLGSILLDNDCLTDVLSACQPEAFYAPRHQTILTGMIALHDAGMPVDLVTLTDHLRTTGTLESVGSMPYLIGLGDQTPTAAYADHYARIVQQKAVLRDIIRTAQRAISLASAQEGSPDEIIAEAQAEVTQLLLRGSRGDFQTSAQVAHEVVEYVDYLMQSKGGLTGATSGLPDLDRALHGFQRGHLCVIAARPAMGKTAFALGAAYAAARAGHRVGVFSLEMPNRDLGLRIACARASVDSERVRRGDLLEREYQKLAVALGEFAEAPIMFNDIADLSVNEIRAKARVLAAHDGVDLLVVDYLQLIGQEGGDGNRVQEVSRMSRGFKLLARELNVPVLLLSQLSRQVESRGNKRPMLSDLRESGSIEQDADEVIFLYRDEYYDPESADVGVGEIIIAKNRNGPTSTVKATWRATNAMFVPYTPGFAGEGAIMG